MLAALTATAFVAALAAFFVAAVLLIVAAVGSASSDEALRTPAAKLALKLDGLLDQIEEPKAEITQQTLTLWTAEILPYFEYEGVTASAVAPTSVDLTLYPAAMDNFHVLGRAYCTPDSTPGPVEINARVANPVSTWFGRADFLATLVHELGHIQGGGLCQGSSVELESTTQIVALEVLAAMANSGNRLALYAVLNELRDMAMSAAQYEFTVSGVRLAPYLALERKVYDTPREKARAAKSARRWASDPAALKDILHKYSKIPVDTILEGLEHKATLSLKLVPQPSRFGFYYNAKPENPQREFRIDDLAYVLDHAAELLAGEDAP